MGTRIYEAGVVYVCLCKSVGRAFCEVLAFLCCIAWLCCLCDIRGVVEERQGVRGLSAGIGHCGTLKLLGWRCSWRTIVFIKRLLVGMLFPCGLQDTVNV
jgi:hypothetical protein